MRSTAVTRRFPQILVIGSASAPEYLQSAVVIHSRLRKAYPVQSQLLCCEARHLLARGHSILPKRLRHRRRFVLEHHTNLRTTLLTVQPNNGLNSGQ